MKTTTLFLFVASAAIAAELHIAPTGNDSNPGTADKPFVTLEKARDSARASAEPDVVVVHGVFRLTKTLELNETDSETTFKGVDNACLTGGITIPVSAIHEVIDATTLARLPERKDKSLRLFEIRLADLGLDVLPELLSRRKTAWPMLVRNGRPLPLAAWPNGEGYEGGFKPVKIISTGTTAKIKEGGASATANTATNSPMIFSVDAARAARWKMAMDNYHAALWLGGHWFWDWADDFLPVGTIDKNGAITMAQRHHYGIGRYVNLHAYNLAEEMDVDGEYALEPAAKRILVLLASANAGKSSLTWLGAPLVMIAKTSRVRFTGIRFEDSRISAVEIRGGNEISFDYCAFNRIGGNAAVVNGLRCSFRNCAFTCLGARGIVLDGGDRKTLTPAGHVVEHCVFDDFGRLVRTYAPAVSLNGVGSTVKNCLIQNAPHSAIIYGGNEHLIVNNEIRNVLTETGDCGAIYSGRDWTTHGTVISGNWIHNLGGHAGRWACGIYLDDQLSGITVKNNWVDHAELGMMIGGGRYNIISGNILSNCKQGISADARGIGRAKKNSILKSRLEYVPVNQEPWKSRYPMLARTLEEHPDRPVGTKITGNAMVGCQKPWLNHNSGGAAVLAPNYEHFPASAIKIDGDGIRVEGSNIRFTKPKVGIPESGLLQEE